MFVYGDDFRKWKHMQDCPTYMHVLINVDCLVQQALRRFFTHA